MWGSKKAATHQNQCSFHGFVLKEDSEDCEAQCLLQKMHTLKKLTSVMTPKTPAVRKDAEAASSRADTVSTVPTLSSVHAARALAITFCIACSKPNILFMRLT